MWRPENWDAREIAGSVKVPKGFLGLELYVEAGADAMLRALKGQGVYGKPSGDFECFCLFPADAPYDSPYDEKLRDSDYSISESQKWKYPDDIEGIKGGEKGWLIFIPDEGNGN